jgi:xanthine dehydrogenase small subunit
LRTDEIRFLLNGERRTLTGVPATRTVLSFLREDLRLTGTKEGCAEGDCGACTVAIADADEHGRISCRAVNSCIQFLPTLDGKAVFTVESLKRGGELHPVQQAMADHHGSQCGFCTPGIVMSLFALYKSDPRPDRAAIEDALSGNLCRCTGYRPIVDAALAMRAMGATIPTAAQEWITAPAGATSPATGQSNAALLDAIRDLKRSAALETRHDSSVFHAPENLQELAVLRSRLPGARLLAGGTDVGLWMTKQLRYLPEVIYLGRIAELRKVFVTETQVVIGAAATLSDVSPVLVSYYPDLATILRRFASPPIRNAATLGGNIANGSPIGDSMPCLIALGARVVLRSTNGTRELALEDFYIDYQKTALQPDEFVERILLPLPAPGQQFRAYKIAKRFDQDISLVLGAFSLCIEGDRIRHCRIAYGGMAAIPKRAAMCEQALEGKAWEDAVINFAADQLAGDFSPIDDLRGSARYRMLVAMNLLKKFHLEVSGATSPTRVEQLSGINP